MVQRTQLFWKANKFPIEVSINYLRFSSRSEKVFDFIIPLLLTGLIMWLVVSIDPSSSTVLKGIKDINNQTLTFISILAGFNIASISVLATSGSKLLEDLRRERSTKFPEKTLFEIMMTFFCAAVVTEFFIIFIGVLLLVISSIINLPIDFNINIWWWIIILLWIYMLITTIFVSVRNLKILFTIMVNEEY
ncbi:hypothetical protein ACQCVH_22345 [Bacillus infantis]|uniref:hypothetical protein n=1 Tax=Bacillus infantis TaxID=324767 RepID=UPI003CECE536